MTAPFKRNPDILASIRKAIADNLKEALSCLSLSKGLNTEKFKEARKCVKRARGALRLIEHSISGKWLEREEDILREVSRVFRDVRDSQVAVETFDRITGHSKHEHPAKTFESIRTKLEEMSQELASDTAKEEKKIKNAISDLQVAIERVDELEVKGDPWKAVREGIRSTYAVCFDAYEDTCSTRSDDSYVEWRRGVKFLRIQLDYLSEYLSEDALEYNKKLHVLSDLLGEYQDILMVREAIKEDKEAFGEKDTVRLILELTEQRMKETGREARKRGDELFEESPKRFMDGVFEEKSNI